MVVVLVLASLANHELEEYANEQNDHYDVV